MVHCAAILRALVYEHPQTWDLSLPLATLAYNSAYHSVLKESPYYLFFLRDVNVPFDNIMESPSPWYNPDDLKSEMQVRANACYQLARKYIEIGADEQEKYRNIKSKFRNIKVGDRVYVKRMRNVTKFSAKYLGPFRVLKDCGVIFWLKELATSKIVKVHADRIKLEEVVDRAENKHVRSAYPIKDDMVSMECEVVSIDELDNEGIFVGTNENEPPAETILDSDIKYVDHKGLKEDTMYDNDMDKESVARSKNAKDLMSYPLRNRGKSVSDTNWVMDRPLEYKVGNDIED